MASAIRLPCSIRIERSAWLYRPEPDRKGFQTFKIRIDRFYDSWVGSRSSVLRWCSQFVHYQLITSRTLQSPPTDVESVSAMAGQSLPRQWLWVLPVTSRCRRRSATDATVLPLRNAALIRGQLPEESAVERLVRWNRSTNTECVPGSTEHHLTELYERPLQEATPPAAAGRRHTNPVQITPDVL